MTFYHVTWFGGVEWNYAVLDGKWLCPLSYLSPQGSWARGVSPSLLHHKKRSLLTALEKHSRPNASEMGNLMPPLSSPTPHIWFSSLSIVIHFDMLFHINKAMWLGACRWPMDCVAHKNPYRHNHRALPRRNGNGVISIKRKGDAHADCSLCVGVCVCSRKLWGRKWLPVFIEVPVSLVLW